MVNVISSELSIASVDSRLMTSVTKNIVKSVSLFCVKCEGCVDIEASQVTNKKSEQSFSVVTTFLRLGDRTAQSSPAAEHQHCKHDVSVQRQAGPDLL